jgi:multisubunit Na+/H+ antiporter MnhE subunit
MRLRRPGKVLAWLLAPLIVAAAPLVYESLGAAASGRTPPPPPGAAMTVTGIVRGKAPVAIIRAEGQTFIAGVGERVGDAVVVSILANRVVLKRGGVTFDVPGPSRGIGPSLVFGVGAPRGTPPPPPGTGMTVTGIVGGKAPVAIIRAEGRTFIVGVGERVGDAVVVSILANRVVLKRGSVTFDVPGPSRGIGSPLASGVGAPRGTPPPPPGTGMTVTGIVGANAPVAIIRAEGRTFIVGVGERVGEAVVVSILTNRVVLKKGGVTFELPIGGKR